MPLLGLNKTIVISRRTLKVLNKNNSDSFQLVAFIENKGRTDFSRESHIAVRTAPTLYTPFCDGLKIQPHGFVNNDSVSFS